MKCRVCGSIKIRELCKLKPYADYKEMIVYECDSCGCRMTLHENDIYERLHNSKNSTYETHRLFADEVEKLFKRRDIPNLKKLLSTIPKNKFVIDTIDANPDIDRILEIGCSKGYLTSYFILKGKKVIGTDISMTALKEAKMRFGNHFVELTSSVLKVKESFDAVYHTGTIGCVERPIAFTLDLLSLLKRAGLLVFNAPNVDACIEAGKKWSETTYPPDLTVLYKKSVWEENFNEIAEVKVVIEKNIPFMNYITYKNKLLGKYKNIEPNRKLFDERTILSKTSVVNRIKRTILERVCPILECLKILPEYTSEFGMYVIIKKK